MNNFIEVSAKDLDLNPFVKIGKEWMLITAGNTENSNTMTASWGGLGVLWGKDVAYTFIRPSRYTFEFTEDSDYFSLCFFDEEYREALNLCGTKSGRDCDKVKESGLTTAFSDGVPYFSEAKLVIICRKMYAQPLSEEFVTSEEVKKHYSEGETYHTMYVGEIIKTLLRE